MIVQLAFHCGVEHLEAVRTKESIVQLLFEPGCPQRRFKLAQYRTTRLSLKDSQRHIDWNPPFRIFDYSRHILPYCPTGDDGR